MRHIIDFIKSRDKDFLLFLLVGVFLGIAQSVDGSTLNNYLKENFQIAILQRSALEVPRELPGFLVFIVIGFLYVLGDIRIAAVANLFAAVGMFLLGIIPANYSIMLMCIFIYSMGQHVYMPLSNSIGMSFANDGRIGRKLGQLSATNTLALVLSSAMLWVLYKFFNLSFTGAFTIGAIAYLCACILLFCMNSGQTVSIKKRFTFRKEYRLFYWLSLLYGARKQIFITFAPWVLVDVFKQSVATMTILFFIISILGIIVKPFIGYLIDKVGERFVLGSEALILIVLCLGYAFAEYIIPGDRAIYIIYACYILDQTFNAVTMARATYLKKIALKDEDVSPTLSLGISIDHVVSMIIPTLGGVLWASNGMKTGYKYVFICGAIIAFINFLSTRMIKTQKNNVEL